MHALSRALTPLTLALTLLACDEGAEAPPPLERPQYTVAVMAELQGGGNIDAIDWAAAKVAAAGGIGGQSPLVVAWHDTRGLTDSEQLRLAETLALDDEVVAVLGPSSPGVMLQIASMMQRVDKPLVSFTSTSAAVLRAFGGSPYIWRTTLTDVAQIEVLLREARMAGARRIGLLTDVGPTGRSFFDGVPFQARIDGLEAVTTEVYGATDEVGPALDRLFAADVDQIIAVPADIDSLQAIAVGLRPHRDAEGFPPAPVVLADTGVDLNITLDRLRDDGRKLRGWQAGHDPDSGFDAGLSAFIGDPRHPHYSAAAHDALLLVAYGLEAAGGATGPALAEGIAQAVAGRGRAYGSDTDGVAATLAALRAGEAPDVDGATGPLEYDPAFGVDPVTGTLRQWSTEQPPAPGSVGLPYLRSVRLGGDAPRADWKRGPSAQSFRAPAGGEAGFEPPARRVALIAAVSGGWSNYRHQADALALYDRLLAGGMHPDDIVFISPDDIADAPQNQAPGAVFNRPGGPDVYRPDAHDYTALTPDEFLAVLRGEPSAARPTVLETDAETDVLVYLAGHGGSRGVSFGAETTAAGLDPDAETALTPTALREALCAMRAAGAFRRALVLVESCRGGVMGSAAFDGLEAGCADGPLTGVLALTAAAVDENSLAAGYDVGLDAWLGDEFSVAVQQRSGDGGSLLDLYRAVYISVAGSHVSAFNAQHFGALDAVPAAAFFEAP